MAVINGHSATLFASAESSFGILPTFVAGDGIRFETFDTGDSQKARIENQVDRTGSRSMTHKFTNHEYLPHEFSFTRSMAPGLTTTADVTELYVNAIGTLSTNTYAPVLQPADSLSFMIVDSGTSQYWAEYFMGAVVTELTWDWSGDVVTETFTCQAARKGFIYRTTWDADPGASGTSLEFNNETQIWYPLGALVDSSDGELGITLSTAVADYTYVTADDVTIANCVRGAPNSTKTLDTDEIFAQVPTATYVGSCVDNTKVTMTWNGAAVGVLGGSLTLRTGRDLRQHDRGESWVSGLVNHNLEASGSFNGIIDADAVDMGLAGDANRNIVGAVAIALGNVVGSVNTINLPKVQLQNFVTITAPDEPLEFSTDMRIRGNAGNDDINVVQS